MQLYSSGDKRLMSGDSLMTPGTSHIAVVLSFLCPVLFMARSLTIFSVDMLFFRIYI